MITIKQKTRQKIKEKTRCCVSGKLPNGKEIIRIDFIDVYLEKQAQYEHIQLARKIAREKRE